MKPVTKIKADGSEQVMLGAVIMKEKPSRKRAKPHDLPFSLENLRMREIESVIRFRHGNGIPDPSGTDDVELCYAYLTAVAFTPESQDVSSWAKVWAPWADVVTLKLLDQQAATRKKALPADAVAKMLFVTLAERSTLGLRTIGACDVSKADRQKCAAHRKRELDRQRQERRRKNEGRVDRASYEAASLSRLKPWLAEGISRRTWERRRVAGLSRIEITSTGDTLASTPSSWTDRLGEKGQGRAAGLAVGLGDHPPAELQEAAPHGKRDEKRSIAA